MTPERVDPAGYDLVMLAMQEPQYNVHSIRTLLIRIAEAQLPCLSIMNMPPLPYLKRHPRPRHLPAGDRLRQSPGYGSGSSPS